MKTKITTLVVLFTFCFANAQQKEVEQEMKSAKGVRFEKGNMFIEGGVSVSTVKDASNSFSINPKFGYLLDDNFAIGLDLDVFGSTTDKKTPLERKNNGFGVGAFARYYFLELDSRRLKVFAEAGFGYSHVKTEVSNVDDTTNGIKANITVGLNYFFTKQWAATFTLADILTYNDTKPENGSSSDSFQLNINLFNNIFAQPKFGLLYKF